MDVSAHGLLLTVRVMIKAVIFDFDGTLAPLSLNFDHMRVEIEAIAGRYVNPDEIERLRPLYTLELIYTIEARLNRKGSPVSERSL